MKAGWGKKAAAATAAFGMMMGTASALAQFAGPAVSPHQPASELPASAMHLSYRDMKIMPGDVISISAVGLSEFGSSAPTSSGVPGGAAGSADGVKVGAEGEVILPYLGVVKLAGMTPPEAAAWLANDLREKGILTDPQVSVQMVDSPTRVITVVGEVARPQPVPAYGQLHLLDVISACGGFTPLASHTVTIRRAGDAQPITVILGTDPRTTDATNIELMAGDTVIVSKVGDVFVVGQVKTPEAIPLSSNAPITVLRAISMSGGVNFGAALSRITILRTTADHQRVEITVNLKKVMDGKEKDVALMSDDVLLVPRNGFKSGMAAGGAGVAGGLTSGLLYRIP